jgi:hypothetical protein
LYFYDAVQVPTITDAITYSPRTVDHAALFSLKDKRPGHPSSRPALLAVDAN